MLAYVDAIVRENTITVDGYTTNKTERGVIKDVEPLKNMIRKKQKHY